MVQSDEGLEKIDRITPCRYGAGTVLLVAFDRENVFVYPGGKRDSGVEDATIVATHMLLAAKAAGVESCWINFFDPEKLAAELGRQMVERAGNAAFVGHRVEVKKGGKKDEKKTDLYTAPKAYNSFLYNLRKLYPKKEGGTA